MKKLVLAASALASFVLAPIASADDHSWYALISLGQAGGSGTQSNLDQATSGAGGTGFSSSVSGPTVYSAHAGYQFNPNLAVEGAYLGSDNQTYTASGGNLIGSSTSSTSIKGWSLAAVGIVPLQSNFSVFGKLGVASMQQSASTETVYYGSTAATSTTTGYKTDVTYGLGLRYDFNDSVFARLDLDSFNVGNSTYANRVTIWALDIGLKF